MPALYQLCSHILFTLEAELPSWTPWQVELCIFYVSLKFLHLTSGLRLAEQLGRREDEAKIRHGLGLSLWASGNLEEAQHQVSRRTLVPSGNLGITILVIIGQKVLASALGLT